MDKLIPDRKDITIIAYDKPISITFFSKHQGWEYVFLLSIMFSHEYRFMYLLSFGIKSTMSFYILSWFTLEIPSFF